MTDLPLLWRPWMPILSIVGIAVVLTILAVFACARTWSRVGGKALAILLMRIAGIAGITVLLLGPSRQQATSQQNEKPKLTILLDTSQSMTTADCGQVSRIAHAAATVLSSNHLGQLQRDFDVELSGFDTAVRNLDPDEVRQRPDEFALGRETHLAEAVANVLSRSRGEGHALLVVSDGRDTSGEPLQRAASAAASQKIPIFTMPLGGASSAPDAALMALAMQDTLLPDEPGTLLVRIYQPQRYSTARASSPIRRWSRSSRSIASTARPPVPIV